MVLRNYQPITSSRGTPSNRLKVDWCSGMDPIMRQGLRGARPDTAYLLVHRQSCTRSDH